MGLLEKTEPEGLMEEDFAGKCSVGVLVCSEKGEGG